MKSIKKIFKVSVLVLALVLIGMTVWHMKGMKHHHPALIPPEGLGQIEPFELTNQDGDTYGSKDLNGNLWLGNFIFTRCAGPCPIMSTRMAALQDDFGPQPNLKFVSFSVDPDFDTPPILKKYAKTYGAKENWHFLTGTRDKMYALIRNQFKLAVKESEHIPHDNDEMQILHSLHFVLVDEKGGIQGYFNSNDFDAMKDLSVKLKSLLKSTS